MKSSGYYDAFGSNPNPAKQVGWRSELEQAVRFELVLDVIQNENTLLDLGCGTGALGSYLRQSGWQGRYIGVDAYPHTQRKVENSQFIHADFTTMEAPEADLIVAIGALVGNSSHTALQGVVEHAFRARSSFLLIGLSRQFLNSTYHDTALEGFEVAELPTHSDWRIDQLQCLISDNCVVGQRVRTTQFRSAAQWLERAKDNVKWTIEELAWVCAQLGLEEEVRRLHQENPNNEIIGIAFEKWQFWHKISLA